MTASLGFRVKLSDLMSSGKKTFRYNWVSMAYM